MDKPTKGFTRLRGQMQVKEVLLEAAVARAESETERRFVRQFYAHVSSRDLEGRSAEQMHLAAASLLARAGRRQPGAATIASGNPPGARHSVVEIVNDDMPFLVDSVTAEINRNGFAVHLVVHPVVRVRRDTDGGLQDIAARDAAPAGDLAESWMRVEFDQCLDAARLAALEAGIARVLADVRRAVADWRPMLAKVKEVAAGLAALPAGIDAAEAAQTREFLDWLADDNFTLLGYREYRLAGSGAGVRLESVPDSNLGLLRDEKYSIYDGARDLADLPPDMRAFLTAPQLLLVNKANARSTVHRPAHLDAITVKIIGADGAVTGERLFVGLYTSMVYVRSPRNIPLLKSKIGRVMARSDLPPRGHDAKALEHILLTYPRDELFQISDDDLLRIATGILQLQDRQRIALFLRFDPFQRFVSALVYIPRERHSTALRQAFQAILEAELNGRVDAYYTTLSDDSASARVHYILRTEPGRLGDTDEAAIEAKLIAAGRGWDERLREALADAHGEARALALLARHGEAFPVGYTASVAPAQAVADIARVDAAAASGKLEMALYRRAGDTAGLRFRIYSRGLRVALSDVLPVLEAMGLKVIEEEQYAIRPAGDETVWLHDYGLLPRRAPAGPVESLAPAFHEAFAQVWYGAAESDGFNALVLAAGLGWREISVLRAYAKYLRQAGAPFSQATIEETLAKHGVTARLLARLFLARAGADAPAASAPAAAAAAQDEPGIAAEIDKTLEAVTNLDEDRILRRLMNLVRATLRTNYRQRQADGALKPALAFKLDSRAVDDLPLPRPMVEIWVYSPRVEGIHLRFGKVARGGIRWSDRRDDFRTEILGLVKTQMVKNAVIVPVGAKGGFVLKQPPGGGARDALQAEGVACYRIFIGALLDLTDNIVDGALVPPAQVTRHDGDDPYLVVAADKGTATFSDIANGISAERGHWLADAFASGGSAGYDHKKMGITARGAWVSVMRHFREMGVDTQSQDFTVVGVGDMSGDVFGNGMLLSPHIRLIAAFDHRHIFLDPDPDPAKSFAERKRLFDLPRSSWADYDRSLLSAGGGVIERGAKSVPLTAEVRRRFGLAQEAMAPAELMRALLTAQCDLLYFGGIGTYVKSSQERHGEVGDRANDAIRVDGREVRAKVIGEGANLGMTQRGRVEYARKGAGGSGGRLNTDAIDNSAGVDTSDHEVNIKILLAWPVRAGALTLPARNALLAEMTDEIAALVLRDNYLQTASLSVTQAVAPALLDRQSRFMRALERAGKLDRAVEFLPDDEALAEREKAGEGLTRPELAVLLAYAKINLNEALLQSDLPDDLHLEGDLLRYFPAVLEQRYGDAARAHRLKREIIATATTNSIVNRAGITFIHELETESGFAAPDIARGYILTRDAFDLRGIWAAIEAHDGKVAAAVQMDALLDVGRFVKRGAKWFLQNAERPIVMPQVIARYHAALAALAADLPRLLPPAAAQVHAARIEKQRKAGFAEPLAARLATLPVLIDLAEIVRLGHVAGMPPEAIAAVYFPTGTRFAFDWLREAAGALRGHSTAHWDKLALSAIIDDLFGHQFALTRAIVAGAPGTGSAGSRAPGAGPAGSGPDGSGQDGSGADGIERWAGARRQAVDQTAKLLADMRAAGTPDLAMLAVANRQLRALVGA